MDLSTPRRPLGRISPYDEGIEQFRDLSSFERWAGDIVGQLEHGLDAAAATTACQALAALGADRNLPRRILGWMDAERSNPPFDLDIGTNPLQIIIMRSRHWRLLMYVWLPCSGDVQPPAKAHDHSSTGYSLIHTGGCYRERRYRRTEGGEYCFEQDYEPFEGEVRVIHPDLVHVVNSTERGGFSFIFWGPRARTTTTVVDVQDGSVAFQESEYVDRLHHLLASTRELCACK